MKRKAQQIKQHPIVLVVDDDPSFVRRLSDEIQGHTQCRALFADTLQQAADYLEDDRLAISAIITDLQFEYEAQDTSRQLNSGVDLLELAERRRPGLLKIVFSVFTSQNIRAQLRNASFEKDLILVDKLATKEPVWEVLKKQLSPEKIGRHTMGQKAEPRTASITLSAPQFNTINAPVDFVIITALEDEREAVLSKLPCVRQVVPSSEDVRVYFASELSASLVDGTKCSFRVIVAPSLTMGRVAAASATADAIRRWRPRYVLLVGIAGGFAASNVKLGDVLVSDQIVDYELQKLTKTGVQVRYNVHRVDPSLLAASINYRNNDWLELIQTKRPIKGRPERRVGPIASGDKVVAFGNFMKMHRKNWPKLIGVEMEAAGSATACFEAKPAPGFFMVRAVSDLADEKKNDNWRGYACDVAASYAIGLIRSGLILPNISKPANSEAQQITARIDVTLDRPFREFDGQRFIKTLADAVGIDGSKIRIESIRSGSTKFQIVGDNKVLSKIINALNTSPDALQALVKATGLSEIAWKVNDVRIGVTITPVSAGSEIETGRESSLTPGPAFDVFLSHNSKDKALVRQLGGELKERGLQVWLDEWELVPGRPWQEALEKVIKTTNSAAVLVGPDGFGPWELPEMRGCLLEFVKRRLPVIPVLLPGAARQPDLPLFLNQFTWVDLRGGLTREGIDRLQWGITGKKP